MSEVKREKYVLAFIFDNNNFENILLIEKTKPAFLAGKYNGIGGKIEPNEFPIEAVAREVFEETGLNLVQAMFLYYGILETEFGSVYLFAAVTPDIHYFQQKEEEKLVVV